LTQRGTDFATSGSLSGHDEESHMSITKTDQGTYRARIRDDRGKQLTKTFKRLDDAKAWERNQLTSRDQGLLVSPSKTTVAEFGEVWLASARDLAPGTIDGYAKHLRLYINPALGDTRLGRLDTDQIDRFITAQLRTGLAPATVHQTYRTLNRLCEVAVQRRKLGYNPCAPVRPPRVGSPEMRFLTAQQVTALADAIAPRFRAMILLAGWGGPRWGEIQALKPQHFDGRSLAIIEQLDGATLKTKGSKRRVILPGAIAEELVAHLEAYPGDYIFTNGNGNPLVHASFSGNHFKPALVTAGLDRETRFHDLRHTAVALAISAGAHPLMIADMVGHKSVRMTLDRYGHLFPSLHEEVAAKMDVLYRNALA
jgi:integrase